MNSSLILFENAQCFLVEVPRAVPLQSRHAYGSEGFLAWFRRRYAIELDSRNWQKISLGDRLLLLIPKQETQEKTCDCRISGNEIAGWTISHPWLGTFHCEAASKSIEDPFPTWLDPATTNAYRCDAILGPGYSGWIATRLAETILYQSVEPPTEREIRHLEQKGRSLGLKAGFWKRHDRSVQKKEKGDLSPRQVWGDPGLKKTSILESGVRYEVDFQEGYSFGLFLDQRENRFRILKNQISPEFSVFPSTRGGRPQVLNTFAYTCAFSVCAALAGAQVVSVDLSRKYLAWGERHFSLNGLNPEEHDFLYGDVFGWLKRFQRRDRRFDLIVLDPPTFSRSKEWGVFKVSRDLPRLVELVVPLLNPGGRLLVSSNAASWAPDVFQAAISDAVRRTERRLSRHEFVSQAWDFGIVGRSEGYLKTWWAEVSS